MQFPAQDNHLTTGAEIQNIPEYAVLFPFHAYTLALEACQIIEVGIGPAFALEAVTKDSENSDEHGEEKINFRSGMGPNYERRKPSNDAS